MKIELLEKLLKSRSMLDKFIARYKHDCVLFNMPIDKDKTKGHLEKALHNLDFVNDTSIDKYSDWVIIGCYYAVYQSALALISSKGWISKNHNATLCVLIKEFYDKMSQDEIQLVNQLFLNYNDFFFYIYSKNKRKEANYSTKIFFDQKTIKELVKNTIKFVRKVRTILESEIWKEN